MRNDPLWRALRLLDIEARRVALAIAAGFGALGSAIALSAVSAWLIARAAQMPDVSTLSVAAVGVRTFGISRGVLRYVERLASHDVALRGMATLRVQLYERLSRGSSAALLAVRRGDLLARVGADVDAVGDVVVRSLLPMAVATLIGVGSAIAMGIFLPAAGISLALCLVLSSFVAPWIAHSAARTTERDSVEARAQMSAISQTLADSAGELVVAGRVDEMLAQLRAADARLARAIERGARASALASAIGPAATGLAALAALFFGIPATTSGDLAAVELAVIVLTPLAVFEASSVLPNAAMGLLRSREAARRVMALLDDESESPATTRPMAQSVPDDSSESSSKSDPAVDIKVEPGAPALQARAVSSGWPDGPVLVPDLDLDLTPGHSVAIVGPSGLGKTTLLLTLAGLLVPKSGEVLVDGVPVHTLQRNTAAAWVTLTTEDAHIFDTSVLENLRVARGDVTTDDAEQALEAVGLGDWLAGLPDGLETRLGSDAARISGGERRRLLVGRALLTHAPVLLLDEPTEHLDAGGRSLLTGLLDQTLAPGRAVVVVTHRLAGLEAAGEVILLDQTGTVVARGPHQELLDGPNAVPAYRTALLTEQQEIE